MTIPSFFDQVFARDPRRIVRFPDVPLDQALAEWKKIQAAPVPAAAVWAEGPPERQWPVPVQTTGWPPAGWPGGPRR